MLARLSNRLGKLNWKYLIVEVLLIVIGINVGLWFNNLNEKSILKQQEREVLEEMLISLRNDQEEIAENLEIHKTSLLACQRLLLPADSLVPQQAAWDLVNAWRYSYFAADYTSYESLKNYGLRLIRDPDLRRKIVKLYNSQYRSVEEASNFHRKRVNNFDEIMNQLFDYQNNRYTFKDNQLAEVVNQAYLIKGLSNSHYYVKYVYEEDLQPAVDSLIMDLEAIVEK